MYENYKQIPNYSKQYVIKSFYGTKNPTNDLTKHINTYSKSYSR